MCFRKVVFSQRFLNENEMGQKAVTFDGGNAKLRRWVWVLALAMLVVDAVLSFDQFYRTPMDGDLPGGVVPADDVTPVLGSPFGLRALFYGEHYPNPNKYFSHQLCYLWFNSVPFLLQRWVSPLDSAYLSCAIAKLLMYMALIVLMAVVVSGKFSFWRTGWMIPAVLMCPMIQSYGYRHEMCIIDSATTYSFFYALPTILLIIYLLPLLMEWLHGREWPRWLVWAWIAWLPLTVFSGPLNPGIALVVCLVAAIMLLMQRRRPSPTMLILLVPLAAGSLYSLFLGTYNILNDSPSLSLWARYAAMPVGIWKVFSGKIAWPLLMLVLVFNSLLLRRLSPSEKCPLRRRWLAVGWFALFYLLLLPFGGYREYRPYIVRYDTLIPLTIGLLYMYVWTTYRLLAAVAGRRRHWWYVAVPMLVIFVFGNADMARFEDNTCERESIAAIAASTEPLVVLDGDCCVVEWTPQSDPELSRLVVQMLSRWNIMGADKRFCHKQPENPDYFE